jgi:lipoprotein signal peptidase
MMRRAHARLSRRCHALDARDGPGSVDPLPGPSRVAHALPFHSVGRRANGGRFHPPGPEPVRSVAPPRRRIVPPATIALVTPAPRIAILTRIALLVAAGDFITKEVAVRWLGALDPHMTAVVRFGVVHNDRAAFGLSFGPNTFELNLALTMAAIVLIIPIGRELTRIDPQAPIALGLILGGALGNFTSLVLEPLGVVDFIAIVPAGGRGLVLNVADVAAYAGLAMLVRTGWMVAREMRKGTRVPELSTPIAHATMGAQEPALAQVHAQVRALAERRVEREVPRPVHREGVAVHGAQDGVPVAVDARDAEIIPIDLPRVRRQVHLEADRARPGFPRPMSHRAPAD